MCQKAKVKKDFREEDKKWENQMWCAEGKSEETHMVSGLAGVGDKAVGSKKEALI